MNHDVYICYDEKDQITANAICHVLEENKIKCWLKTRDLGVSHLVDGIMEAINEAKVMVLIFSSHSKNSNFVNTEVDLAFTENIPILVFKIDESKLDGGLEFFLNNKHWLDAYPDPEVKFDSLIRDTSKLLGKPISKPIVSNERIIEEQDASEEVSEPVVEQEVVEETVVEEVSEPVVEQEVVEEVPEPVVEKPVAPKKEVSKPQKPESGSGGLLNNKILIIAIVAIIAAVLAGGYFLFNGQPEFDYSAMELSDTAYMDIPEAPNATAKADKNGLFFYVDDEHGVNVTSCNSNVSKKSAVTKLNELKTAFESGANQIQEGNIVIFEKDGIYSVFSENKETHDMVLIQSKDKDVLLKCYESITYHSPMDSLKVEESKTVVNATKETQTAIKQSSSSSSSSGSSSSDSSNKADSSTKSSTPAWDKDTSSSSSSKKSSTPAWDKPSSSSKSSSSSKKSSKSKSPAWDS
jgi:hypothetical protein